MEYDFLFKRLLKAFFRFFMELFFPQVAAHIQWELMEFIDTEEQSQATKGQDDSQSFRRAADILVKVSTLDDDQVLIHVEIENPWRSTFPFRMYEYFSLQRTSHGVPVFPIAILPERRINPFGVETYKEGLFGHQTLIYTFFHIGLAGLLLDEYWVDDNPISWAFSAFMNRGNRDKVQLMGECYRRIYESSYTDEEKILLLNFIRTYYQLTPDEEARFRDLLGQETHREVRAMELSYYGKVAQQAKQEGRHEGRHEGRQEGRQEGMHLILLQQLQNKFGELPRSTTDRVKAIQSQEELTALATKVLAAESLADLGLDGAA